MKSSRHTHALACMCTHTQSINQYPVHMVLQIGYIGMCVPAGLQKITMYPKVKT